MLKQQAKFLRQQLEAARKAQRAAAKQEEMQRKEEERRQKVAEALELVEFMKNFELKNGSTAYAWMKAELDKANAVSSEAEEDSVSGNVNDSSYGNAETENQYSYQSNGYYNN